MKEDRRKSLLVFRCQQFVAELNFLVEEILYPEKESWFEICEAVDEAQVALVKIATRIRHRGKNKVYEEYKRDLEKYEFGESLEFPDRHEAIKGRL